MKTLLLTATALFAATFSFSQTTAQDWTKTDCASNSVNLFSILDANEVVVMEFGMGCGTCTNAANYLINTLKTKYDVSAPGKVNFFYMDYWTGNTCSSNVQPVLSSYPFNSGFDNCMSEKNYYMTGSPMPAIVIVAGSSHAVIYEKNSFSNGDTTTIRTTIDNALTAMSVPAVGAVKPVTVSPNPSNGVVTIEAGKNIETITVYDITGKQMYTAAVGKTSITIDFSNALPKGTYFVETVVEGKKNNTKLIIR